MAIKRRRTSADVFYRAKRRRVFRRGIKRRATRRVVRRAAKRRKVASGTRLAMPRKLGMLQPQRILVKLRQGITDTHTVTTGQFAYTTPLAVGSQQGKSFLPLLLRDVNPVVADENFPEEFVNYMRLYTNYIVRGVKITAHLFQPVQNQDDNFYSCFYAVPALQQNTTPSDPYNLLSAKAVEELLIKKALRKKWVIGTGADNAVRNKFHSVYYGIERIQQMNMNTNREEFSGSATTAGASFEDPMYRPLIIHKLIPGAPGGAPNGNVVSVRYTLTFYVEFFNRRRDIQLTIGEGPDPPEE